MTIDLSSEIRRSLFDTLARARKHYDAGEDDKAAKAYELASQLALKLAERAPDRQTEARHKKEAIRFREVAKRLEAGEAPPVAERGPDRDPARRAAGAAGAKGGAGRDKARGLEGPPGRRGGGDARDARDKDGIEQAVSALVTSSPVTWAEIGGLEETKQEIKYALALSIAKPPAGVKVTSFRNMLFYGPPGTGKTLLAAATSNALRVNQDSDRKAVFYNVKTSSLMSKYFGESTRLVSELYGQARDSSPAVVFLDEIDALAGSRDKEDSGTERRILSTLLAELDGLAEKGRSDLFVLTIAATNRPWDLDAAVLSRFDKKIYIPLPDALSREAILGIHLDRRGYRSAVGVGDLVAMTEGMSGRELERFAKEVQNRMIAEENRDLPALVDQGLDALRGYQVKVRELRRDDFERAAQRITPQTTPLEVKRYLDWRESTSV